MSCNETQLQMSLCLDGRLPAGSRATVLAHIAGCADCERVWTDLQKAQDLVLNLPVQKTSRDFRQTLWARIESGEGAPEVRLAEPVTIMAKARYVLAGAAAAAVLLVSGKLLMSERTKPLASSDAPQIIAKADPIVDDTAKGLHPKPRLAPDTNAQVIDFNPATLASTFAERTARNVRTLRSRLCAGTSQPPSSFVEPEVRTAIDDLRSSAEVVRWLRDSGLLGDLPPEVDADLRILTRTGPGIADSQIIQAAVCEGAQLEQLPRHLFVRPSFDQGTFLRQFKVRFEADPSFQRMFSLQIPDAGGQILVMIQGVNR